MTGPPKTIKATENSIQILEVIKDHEGTRLSELKQELDLSKSSIHNHLRTLMKYGWVIKRGERYYIGLKPFHLSKYAKNRKENLQFIKEKTAKLANELNQAVDFDVFENGRMITLFHEVSEATEIGFTEGAYFYMHSSATGKAVLADLPKTEVDAIVDRWGLERITDQTITDRKELHMELDQIREQGYAVSDQEWLEGLYSIASSVSYPNGRPLGSISTEAPTYRIDNETEKEISEQIIRATNELESELKKEVGKEGSKI